MRASVCVLCFDICMWTSAIRRARSLIGQFEFDAKCPLEISSSARVLGEPPLGLVRSGIFPRHPSTTTTTTIPCPTHLPPPFLHSHKRHHYVYDTSPRGLIRIHTRWPLRPLHTDHSCTKPLVVSTNWRFNPAVCNDQNSLDDNFKCQYTVYNVHCTVYIIRCTVYIIYTLSAFPLLTAHLHTYINDTSIYTCHTHLAVSVQTTICGLAYRADFSDSRRIVNNVKKWNISSFHPCPLALLRSSSSSSGSSTLDCDVIQACLDTRLHHIYRL